MSGAATRNLVAASTTGQEYLTLKTLILKKPEIIIIIINACENFEVGKENYKTTGVRPSYSLPPHPLPSPTHQRLIYPIRKVLLSLEPKLHPTTKRREKKYPSQVDQVILSTHQHNPKYMATNA